MHGRNAYRWEDEVRPLVDAMKVLLLNPSHRFHLQFSDPMGYQQAVNAVRNIDPGIDEEIRQADANHREAVQRAAFAFADR